MDKEKLTCVRDGGAVGRDQDGEARTTTFLFSSVFFTRRFERMHACETRNRACQVGERLMGCAVSELFENAAEGTCAAARPLLHGARVARRGRQAAGTGSHAPAPHTTV